MSIFALCRNITAVFYGFKFKVLIVAFEIEIYNFDFVEMAKNMTLTLLILSLLAVASFTQIIGVDDDNN